MRNLACELRRAHAREELKAMDRMGGRGLDERPEAGGARVIERVTEAGLEQVGGGYERRLALLHPRIPWCVRCTPPRRPLPVGFLGGVLILTDDRIALGEHGERGGIEVRGGRGRVPGGLGAGRRHDRHHGFHRSYQSRVAMSRLLQDGDDAREADREGEVKRDDNWPVQPRGRACATLLRGWRRPACREVECVQVVQRTPVGRLLATGFEVQRRLLTRQTTSCVHGPNAA